MNEEKKLFEEFFCATNIHKMEGRGCQYQFKQKKFPLLQYIAAVENLCQALEEYGVENKEYYH